MSKSRRRRLHAPDVDPGTDDRFVTMREGTYIKELIWSRNGTATTVKFADDTLCTFSDGVPGGKDLGNTFDHIFILDKDLELGGFYTSEVVEVMGEHGAVLFRAKSRQVELKETEPDGG